MAYEWEVVQTVKAPIEIVWGVVTDARKWNEWGRFKKASLEKLGDGHDDGVGSIRAFGNPPMISREEVVVSDAPTHQAYTLLSGLPVVGYRADVHLTFADGITTVRWQSRFDHARPRLASGFFAWFLRRFITDTAKRMARHAESLA